ncbi:MAG: hypothetical protein JKY10_03825 [Cohaesibacteraceae bacterium]|nr:hypothetical protein [Cohaesibacteraceae bacterium]
MSQDTVNKTETNSQNNNLKVDLCSKYQKLGINAVVGALAAKATGIKSLGKPAIIKS